MDLLNKVSTILDKNVRVLQYTAPVLASVGIVILLRRTHAFSMFNSVHKIPKSIISHNWNLRGVVEGVVDERILSVQHIPIFFRNLKRRKRFFGQDPLPMHVAIAGLEPRTGCWEYLQKEVLLQPIRIVPLGIGSNNGECLEAVIFLKKTFFSRSVCLNEEIIKRGLAVVHYNQDLSQSKAYMNLSRRLLRAELYADKKGIGLWKRLSTWQRFRVWIPSLKMRLPFSKKNS